jgi:hypothetical protein
MEQLRCGDIPSPAQLIFEEHQHQYQLSSFLYLSTGGNEGMLNHLLAIVKSSLPENSNFPYAALESICATPCPLSPQDPAHRLATHLGKLE